MSLKVEMEMKAMLVIKYVNGQNSAEKFIKKLLSLWQINN